MSIISATSPTTPTGGASPSSEVRTLHVDATDRRKWDNFTSFDIDEHFISGDLSILRPKTIFNRIIVALFANYYRSADVVRNVESLIDRCCPIVTGSEAETINADDLAKLGHATPNISRMKEHFVTRKAPKQVATERTTLVQRENPVLQGISGQLDSASSKAELAFNRVHRATPAREHAINSSPVTASGRASTASGRASTVSDDAISIPSSPEEAHLEEIVSAFTTVRTSLSNVPKEEIQRPVLTHLLKRLTAVIGKDKSAALLKMNPATEDSIRSLELTAEQYTQVRAVLEDVAPKIEQYKRAVEKVKSGDSHSLKTLNRDLGQLQEILARNQASYDALVAEYRAHTDDLDRLQVEITSTSSELSRLKAEFVTARRSLQTQATYVAVLYTEIGEAEAEAEAKAEASGDRSAERNIMDLKYQLSVALPLLEDAQNSTTAAGTSIETTTKTIQNIIGRQNTILARIEVLEAERGPLETAEASIAEAKAACAAKAEEIVGVKAQMLVELQERLFPIS